MAPTVVPWSCAIFASQSPDTTDPAMNSMWLTADGGQRDQMSQPKVVIDAQGRKDVERKPLSSSHEAAFIVGRLFGENTPGHGQLNNLHWFPAATTAFGWYIEGWLDITHPNVPFSKLAYDPAGSEQDFLAMRKRLRTVEHHVIADRIMAQQMIAPP